MNSMNVKDIGNKIFDNLLPIVVVVPLAVGLALLIHDLTKDNSYIGYGSPPYANRPAK